MSSIAQTILVTGANKGIGYEAIKLLSQHDSASRVIMGTRSLSNGEAALKKMKSSDSSHSYENVSLLELDITSQSSIKDAVSKVKSDFGQLDVLVHNSAISVFQGDLNSPVIMETNVTGARDAVLGFLPLIPKDGHVIVVSSTVGSWSLAAFNESIRGRLLDDPKNLKWEEIETLMQDWLAFAQGKKHKEQWPALSPVTNGYFISKGFLSPWCRAFAATHPDIKTAVTCPGYCATDLNDHQGTTTPAEGAESILWPLYNNFKNGQFYQYGKELDYVIPMPTNWGN